MKLLKLLLLSLLSFLSILPFLSFSALAIDCRTNELNNLISSHLSRYTVGNAKHVELTNCSLDASGEQAIIRMDIHARSKDQTTIRLGLARITKTLYDVSSTLKLVFILDEHSCTVSLAEEHTDFHSQGVISSIVRGILEIGKPEIRQRIRESINNVLQKRGPYWTQFCM
ncbi:MAG: hypothetical protein HQK51_17325 [Oligoflexia bacterium]|nr:hypothetical protein [Oligoflexia bacterium]